MWDKIKEGKDRLEVHGIGSGWVPHIAEMWENEPYNGRVVNNLFSDYVVDKPTMPNPVVYFDDIYDELNELMTSKRAMDMASERGYDTMEIGRIHKGKSHGLATDIYFYTSDEE